MPMLTLKPGNTLIIQEGDLDKPNKRFPVGGPRQPVYDFMRGLGFSMSVRSDKHWSSADGLQVRIYGTGSMAQIYRKDDQLISSCELDNLATEIDQLRLNTE